MKIIKLAPNFFLYHIPSNSVNKLGQNIYALLDQKQALLIDTGYQDDCRLVLDDLTGKGIKVVKVVPSHFHPDHVEGLYLLDSPEVYGNAFAIESLQRFYEGKDLEILAPGVIIKEGYKLKFGEFELSFQHVPGHSNCSQLININDKFLHVGDLYMKSDLGEEVLPYVSWSGVKQHIESLDKVLLHKEKIFLLAHGLCPLEIEEIKIGISDRKEYLQSLLDSNNTISVEEAVKNCSRPFNFLKWREAVK